MWNVDIQPPLLTGAVVGPVITNSVNTSVQWQCSDDRGALCEICVSLDGGTESCLDSENDGTVTTHFQSHGDGVHVVSGIASDATGNRMPWPVPLSWTLDTTTPVTHVNVSLSSYIDMPRWNAIVTPAQYATVWVSANEPLSGFLLSSTRFSTTTTMIVLSQGVTSLSIRAVDVAGNVDTNPVIATATAPGTQFTQRPPVLSNSTQLRCVVVGNFLWSPQMVPLSYPCNGSVHRYSNMFSITYVGFWTLNRWQIASINTAADATNTMYVVVQYSSNNGNCTLLALNSATGTTIWSNDGRPGATYSVVLDSGAVTVSVVSVATSSGASPSQFG